MLNQTIIVGRLVDEPTKQTEGKERTIITLACPRSFKNSDGIYETDFISCVLWEPVGSNVVEYCHKGDVLGVKGRLQTTDGVLEVMAEKVTFLSSKPKDSEE